MELAVELVLDNDAADAVRRCWDALAQNGTAPFMANSRARPHLTMAIFDLLREDQAAPALAAIAREASGLRLTYASIGVFPRPDPVVFLAPIVDTQLLQFHAAVHRILAPHTRGPWKHYLPGAWVPHTTLALEFPPEHLPAVIATCAEIPIPLQASPAQIGVVAFPPPDYRHTCTVPAPPRQASP